MYYPKSQIKTDLYTNGKELMFKSTKQEYIGPYYEISTGKKFVGKKPSKRRDIELIPLSVLTPTGDSFESVPESPKAIFPQTTSLIVNTNNFSNNPVYFDLKNKTYQERLIPTPIKYIPKSTDLSKDFITRYFCKKNNEFKYFEIDRETHIKLISKNPSIAFDLYSSVSIKWVLKGNEANNINLITINKIEKNNRWYGFKEYLTK